MQRQKDAKKNAQKDTKKNTQKVLKKYANYLDKEGVFKVTCRVGKIVLSSSKP